MALYTGKLNLSKEYRDEADPYIISLALSAIGAHSQRDDELADNDDLLELVELEGLPSPYEGSCTLNDILPLEQFITLYSQIMTSLYRDTIVTISAEISEEKDGAHKTENWLRNDWKKSGYIRAKAMQFYNMLRDKAGILYGGYCDRTIQKRARMYAEIDKNGKFKHWNEEDEQPEDLIEQKYRQEGTEYAPTWVTRDEIERKAEYHAVNQVNFYLIPPDAPSIEEADLSLERILLTRNQLLEGIDRYGYEKDKIMELIKAGETHVNAGETYRVKNSATAGADAPRERENDLAGVTGMSQNQTGVYECFLAFGKLPKLWQEDTEEAEAKLPKKYWNTESIMMFCPSHSIIFMLKPSPFPGWKPYTSVSLIEKPDRAYGRGLMDIIEPLAREATNFLRAVYNGLEIEMMPEYGIDDESWDRNKNRKRYPGKVWKLSAGGTITSIPTSGNSRLGMEPLLDCRSRATTLIGAQGVGEIQTKVRKEAEIVSATTKADAKTQLYQFFAFLSIPEEAKRRVEMELLFNPDYTGKITNEEEELEITAQDLDGNYTYTVATLGEDSSPEARSRRAGNILAIQKGYLEMFQQFPLDGEQLWNGARIALLAERIRNVEEILGKKPASRQELEAQQAAAAPAPGTAPPGAPMGQPPPPGMGSPPSPMGIAGNGTQGGMPVPVGMVS